MFSNKQPGTGDRVVGSGVPQKPVVANPPPENLTIAAGESPSMPIDSGAPLTTEHVFAVAKFKGWVNFSHEIKRSSKQISVLEASLERRSGEFPVPWVRWRIHGGPIKVFRPNSLPRQLLRRLYMPAAEARYSVIHGDGVSPVRVKQGDVIEVSTRVGLKYYLFDVHSVDPDTDRRRRRGMPNSAGANLQLSPGDNVAFTPRKAPEMLKERRQLEGVPPLQVKKAPRKL